MSGKPRIFLKQGERINRWTALKEAGRRGPRRFYLCRCDCGKEKEVPLQYLLDEQSKSCGCLRQEETSVRKTKHGHAKGGDAKRFSREYVAWRKIRQRCTDIGCPQYPYYGGRGITLDPVYDDFKRFLTDVGPKPSPGHSIGRIDNERGYEPGNIRWESKEEQMRNMRSNVFITYNGETHTLSEWSRKTGIPLRTLHYRIRVAGWSVERALTLTPSLSNRRIRK